MFSCKTFRLGNYPLHENVRWKSFCSLFSITKNTLFCDIKPIPIHPCFACINIRVITNTVFHKKYFQYYNFEPCQNHLRAVRKFLIHKVLFIHESTHEIYKHCIEANLHGKGVTKKYQVHL